MQWFFSAFVCLAVTVSPLGGKEMSEGGGIRTASAAVTGGAGACSGAGLPSVSSALSLSVAVESSLVVCSHVKHSSSTVSNTYTPTHDNTQHAYCVPAGDHK